MKDARSYLITKGVHTSQQRIVIMDYLMKHRTHPTADEIYTALYRQMPTLSRTTVYNTLKLFAENGVIQVINIDEKNARFDACTDAHAHFLCHQCGTIYDISLPAPQAGEMHQHHNPNLEDFIVTNSQLYYKGICPKCRTHVKYQPTYSM